jgi:GTPase
VVAGVVNSGTIHNGDTMWMGPNATDDFIPVTIRNIQRKRVDVPFVTAGQSASFALKKIRRRDIRKGMVMLQKTELPPQAIREFTAEGISVSCRIYL